MPYPVNKIIENIRKGIAKAQKDYECWSGGYWLWVAPEYFMTTYIAREMATYSDCNYYITLEGPIKDAIDDAGGMGTKRLRDAMRTGGRCDTSA